MFDPASTAISPPRKLGVLGSSLWQSIQAEYRVDDAAGRELLAQACAADRVARLSEKIDADGEVIETKAGVKVHPAVREELAGRQFICRTLQALGLNLEAARPVGRPTAWRKRQEDREDADK
jgi:ribosomal protein L13E